MNKTIDHKDDDQTKISMYGPLDNGFWTRTSVSKHRWANSTDLFRTPVTNDGKTTTPATYWGVIVERKCKKSIPFT